MSKLKTGYLAIGASILALNSAVVSAGLSGSVPEQNYTLNGPYQDPADPVHFRAKEESAFLYGDFYSWDLLIESYYYSQGLNTVYPLPPTGDNPYNIGATPGAIDLTMNVYEGSNNQGSVPNDNYEPTVCGTATGGQTCDDAYDPNQGSNLENTWFTMFNRDDPEPEPGVLFDDEINTWDADLAAVLEYLTFGGEVFDPVFYYAHNQTGVNPDLFVIGQVFFEGGGLDTLYFDFLDPTGGFGSGGLAGGCDPVTSVCDQHTTYDSSGRLAQGAPDAFGTNADLGNFVLSPGENCLVVDADGVPVATCEAFPGGPGDLPAGWSEVTFPHNIGNQGFDYAVWAPEIDIAAFLGQGYTTMRIDFRLGCRTDPAEGNNPSGCFYGPDGQEQIIVNGFLDNGDETLVIGRKSRDQQIPAPGTLLLVAGGLLGLNGLRQRSKASG